MFKTKSFQIVINAVSQTVLRYAGGIYMNLLKISGLTKNYGKGKAQTQALRGIELNIDYGDFVAIMGASGSGKSTLLNIISTIDKPTEGTLIIDNTNIVKLSATKANEFRKNYLGFIFQDFKLLDSLSVEENISVPLMIQKKKRKEIESRLAEIMTALGINDLKKKYPYEISGGEKQRTACARAIAGNPKLILADEPTGALDSNNAQNIMNILSRINSNFHTTILLVTHDPMSASYSNQVVFLKDGKIVNTIKRTGLTEIEFYNKIIEYSSKMQQVLN